jgi:hypothetical protein
MRRLTLIAGVSLCAALMFPWSAPAGAASASSDTTSTAVSPSDTTAAKADSTRSSSARGTSLLDLIRAATARGDSLKTAVDSTAADSMGAPGDSTLSAAESAAIAAAKQPPDRFVPTSTSRVESTDISVAIGTKLNTQIDAGRGWTFMNDISMERRRYRQRVMEDITENAMNRADKKHEGLYALSMQAGESYSKKKTLGLGRFGQDIIFDNVSAGADFSFVKPLFGAAASNFAVSADASKGTNDFKFDRAYSGSASGGVQYVIGDILTVGGGAGRYEKRESSYIGRSKFGPMPSNGDSLRAALSYGRSQTKLVDVSYNWFRGVDRKVMPPLGNTYEVLADPTLAKREEARNRSEQLLVSTYLQPFSFLDISTAFKHSRAIQKYRVDTRLSMESETNSMDATANYAYAARGKVQLGVSTSDALSDYGPVSLSSYRERQYVLSARVSQKVGDSLSVNLGGSGSLKQRFYLKQDVNPRDADYLFYRGDFSLRAPYPKFGVDVNGTIDRYETINIDNTLSGDNRIEYKYELGPRLTLKPATWLSLSQDYIVKIEFTDFVYTEDKNYLNRTTTLNTRGYFTVFRSCTFNFLHSYLKKDTGSYLMRSAGRRYSPSNETFDHTLDMTVRYQLIQDFLVKAESNFRIQRSNVIASRNGQRIISSSTTYESGGMNVGFERTMKFGDHGGVALDVSYVKNYGPYITPERKEYWLADAELTLKF